MRLAKISEPSLKRVDREFCGLTRKSSTEGRSMVLTSHDDNLLGYFGTSLLRFQHRTLAEID